PDINRCEAGRSATNRSRACRDGLNPPMSFRPRLLERRSRRRQAIRRTGGSEWSLIGSVSCSSGDRCGPALGSRTNTLIAVHIPNDCVRPDEARPADKLLRIMLSFNSFECVRRIIALGEWAGKGEIRVFFVNW